MQFRNCEIKTDQSNQFSGQDSKEAIWTFSLFLWCICWCRWNKFMLFSMMAMMYIILMYFRCSVFASSLKSMSDNPLSSLMLVLKKPHYLWLLRMKSWCGIHPRRWTPLFPKIHIGYRRWVWRPNKQLLQLLMDSFCSFGTITFELIRK